MADTLRSPGRSLAGWATLVATGLLVAGLTGRLEPHVVPDSPSYLQYPFESAAAMARSIRTPGYPVWVRAIQSTLGLRCLPAAQVVLHATAVFWLCRELACWQMPRRQVVATGIAVALGCTPADTIATVASDAPAASIGVMLVAAVMRLVRRRWPLADAVHSGGAPAQGASVARSVAGAMPVVLLAIAAVMLRPAYLFVVPWLPAVILLLGWIRGARWPAALRSGVLIAVPVLALLMGWMVFRFAAAGDFGLLPFGHQNMAGVLVQLVSDEELAALDGASAGLGNAVVRQKRTFLDAGGAFADGEPGATMTIDARWDAMTYGVVVPAARQIAGDDPIDQHEAVAELNGEIIRRYPLRYLTWIAKATRLGAWRVAADIVMHPLFLLAIMIGGAVTVVSAVAAGAESWTYDRTLALRALTVVTVSYLVAKLGFVILSSPPIGRFSDAAAIFLPGWLAAVYLNLRRGSPHRSPGVQVQRRMA